MTHPSTPLPVAPVGAWDRLAIVALGSAGCALSYDALQQMAVAIHVRGFLTYLFPLVIDGFIAYGVRALILTRTAPWHARAYVWTLFGTATAASIWANALHAVRLNQQTAHEGLRLGDTVVAILSTLAPLALAGAVHLYILITRHHPQPVPAGDAAADGDEERPVPVPGRTVDGNRGPHRLSLVPDPATGARTDQCAVGDRPAGASTGARSGTAVPSTTGDRDRPAVPEMHPGDRPAPRQHPADGDRGPGSDTVPDGDGNESGDREGDRDDGASVADVGDQAATDSACGVEPAGEPGTRTTRPQGNFGDASDAVPGTGPTANNSAPPTGTEPTGDGPRPAPASKGGDRISVSPDKASGTKNTGDSPKGTGDRSRSSAGKRSPQLTEDEVVQRLRPHVPAVLKRDGNSAITRVQLRQIMRAQNIAIRNDRLTPVLQRLRSETAGTTTTRSSAR
ncbi:DUF2637 domain-containing protein [Streptomyces albireticuli]|uniref:DUF2637 domain-containing protein n=1 Tax=Streptomyces albireticuli TaxID=1940 RepID=UPI001E5AD9E7|nr:DUF2637 domain-containing protein [Streptomyces albireticuli]MCD9193364.1 DUF2637 domain-containing protein [Streptomyces albireticuli]